LSILSFSRIVPRGARNKPLENVHWRCQHFRVEADWIGIMPYQVKAGSLIIVATNSAEALKIFDSLQACSDEPVVVRDMDGIDIDPERFRSTMAELSEWDRRRDATLMFHGGHDIQDTAKRIYLPWATEGLSETKAAWKLAEVRSAQDEIGSLPTWSIQRLTSAFSAETDAAVTQTDVHSWAPERTSVMCDAIRQPSNPVDTEIDSKGQQADWRKQSNAAQQKDRLEWMIVAFFSRRNRSSRGKR
jgi:hypothetical protein